MTQWFCRFLKVVFKFRQCIFTILLLSLLGEKQSPSFGLTWIPFTQWWFVQSMNEINPVVLENFFFFKVFIIFSLFCSYLPLKKEKTLHLNKLESPSSNSTLYHVWLKLGQWFWQGRWKFEMFTNRQTNGKAKFTITFSNSFCCM